MPASSTDLVEQQQAQEAIVTPSEVSVESHRESENRDYVIDMFYFRCQRGPDFGKNVTMQDHCLCSPMRTTNQAWRVYELPKATNYNGRRYRQYICRR